MIRLFIYLGVLILALVLIWLPAFSQGLDNSSFLFASSMLASLGIALLLLVHGLVHGRKRRR